MSFLLTLLTPLQWFYVALAVVAVLLINRSSIFAAVGNFKLPGGTTTVPAISPNSPVDEDALDLQAYRRLQARFKRLACKEGQAAMDTAGQHFLHGTGGP